MIQPERLILRVAAAIGFSVLSASAQWIPNNPVRSVQKQGNGLLLHLQTGTLRLDVCSPDIVHVIYAPEERVPEHKNFVVVKTDWSSAPWEFKESSADVTLSTSRLRITVNRTNSLITYTAADGKPLLVEGPKKMTPVVSQGEHTYTSEDVFKVYGSEEGFYGLGQHQAGVWNYRGEAMELSQDNTNISIPFFLSSRGYGVYWNNSSVSRWNNRFIHYLFVGSEVADTIDYYFFYGPEFDRLIADYRELTGQAPLFGKWSYGFWQSKNKYASQDELESAAKKYRELHIPIDNIVQDWFWWTTTGEFKFNSKYPDPRAMVDKLHEEHYHLMISVWPFFDPGSATYDDMDKRGYFIAKTPVAAFHPKGAAVYDAFNPEARKYYWNQMDNALFKIGADAWWLDTTEPETEGRDENILTDHKIAAGNGARYADIYALMTTMGVYNGQRSAPDEKRVFILSRSAAPGAQRYAVTAWSGDVLSDFLTYKRQIPAGLNYSLSGLPYWTTDIGGFILGQPDDPAYRELFVRWFEYGVFCPIFRTHGTRSTNANELWSYGPDAESILVNYDRLRYRLLPYIYSLAWMTTHDAYTPMRPLVMDYREDVKARNIGDEFFYGPAILVSPVTEQGATSRRVYLPNARFYDFWNGEAKDGPTDVEADAPLSRIPLYIRAGSIIPLGPDVEWSSEKPADPIELRIYPGADADFTLYEDQGDGYAYEKGVYSTIPIHWSNETRTLKIGDRAGSFPGMLASRTFRIVFAGNGHGAGIDNTPLPDRVITYDGKAIEVKQ